MGKFIIGLILGILIAAILAYYLSNSPRIVNRISNTSNKQELNKTTPINLAPGTTINPIIEDEKKQQTQQEYDFYDILSGNKKGSSDTPGEASKGNEDVFIIQVGLYDNQDEANDMKARLALLGVDSQIKSQQQGDVIINRVIIGAFTSLGEAKDVLERINSEHIKGVIIKIKQ